MHRRLWNLLLACVLLMLIIPAAASGIGISSWGLVGPLPGVLNINALEQPEDEVIFAAVDDGWESEILRSTNGGVTWDLSYGWTDTISVDANIQDIDFVDPMTGWAVGSYVNASGAVRLILKTVNGGRSWTRQDDGVGTAELPYNAVDAASADRVIAVGYDGVFAVTEDGGSSWSEYASFSYDFRDVAATLGPSGELRAVAVGDNGAIMRITHSTGVPTVATESSPALATERLNGVAFGSQAGAVAVGLGEFWLGGADYGNVWARSTSIAGPGDTEDRYYDCDSLADGTGYAVGYRQSVPPVWTRSHVAYTEDGGSTWSFPELPTAAAALGAVAIHDSGEVCAGGDNMLFHKATTTVFRLGGATRYETACMIARSCFPVPYEHYAVLATAKDFPDALAAGGLAGARDAPLYLVGDTVPDDVLDELKRLDATHIYIVGGTAAVPESIEQELIDAGITTIGRIAGQDRYETAVAVAQRMAAWEGGVSEAIICRGDAFPDALAASPLSYARVTPILLTRPDSLPDSTAEALDALGIDVAILIGGDMAISPDVHSEIYDIVFGMNTGVARRVSGDTRYETAVAVAEEGIRTGDLEPGFIGVATGTNYPDALAGGVACGAMRGPLLLTRGDSLDPSARGFIEDYARYDTDTRVFGGPVAVSAAVLGQIEDIY